MHFWIDKRSSQCYTGRRVPPSLSSGRGRKIMAAPLHRFANVEPPRRHRPITRPITRAPVAPPQPSIAMIAAARCVTPDTLLRSAALGLQPTPLISPHLKCGLLLSLALATIFVAAAKFYFERRMSNVPGMVGEVGGSLILVLVMVMSAGGLICAYWSRRVHSPTPLEIPERVCSTARRAQELEPEEMSLPTLSLRPPPPPPPPYHIAVLLPPRDPDAPPDYSAVS